ncbi:MAG: P-loop NTPase [Deltaproteobacteria bacterium]|nr:P-loop NTPase [Deltaproteobacteria bacterium]
MASKEHGAGHASQDDKHALQDFEIQQKLFHIKNKILVMSGKGGVGKSSVAAYLAVSLAKKGFKVGLMDVDLHGPSIPRLLGLQGTIQPSSKEGKATPVYFMPNLEVISIETLMGENKDVATIWRGPLKIGVIRQFISDIEWDDLDFLVIDSPPGTGDEPLTVAQTIPDAKALIVTTPQEISLADVRKSINFCRIVKMEIIGIVENMSGLICPHCQKEIDLFGARGGELLAKKENLPLIGKLPLDPEVVRQGDAGRAAAVLEKDTPYGRAFSAMVDEVVKRAGDSRKTPFVMHPPQTAEQAQAEPSPRSIEPLEEESNMDKVIFAVPVAGGKLCAHFGHCEQFALVETEKGEIKGKTMHTPPAHEPGVLPAWLHEMGAHIIIAGGMGSRAQGLFNENGIRVITGAPQDSPESLVNQYLKDSLVTGGNICDH